MVNEYCYVATCMFGLEKFVNDEIKDLGYEIEKTIDGRVYFKGDSSVIARFNINSRYSERLYFRVKSFKATCFDELFDNCRDIEWHNFIEADNKFVISGHSIKSNLFSIRDMQKIIKKAIATELGTHYCLPYMPETKDEIRICFFMLNNICDLMINLSGETLHKRGYRTSSVEAPLRETLAAALIKISRQRENVVLWDPFCGSSTLAIEAALQMTNTAPGINRSFISERYNFVDPYIWDKAREEAIDLQNLSTEFRVFSSDIDEKAIEISNECIKKANMQGIINCFQQDALTIKSNGLRGTIVTNPPYGERMLDYRQAADLYHNVGIKFKKLEKWKIYILSSHTSFEKEYGMKADKVRKIYNGNIPCYFFQFFKEETLKK